MWAESSCLKCILFEVNMDVFCSHIFYLLFNPCFPYYVINILKWNVIPTLWIFSKFTKDRAHCDFFNLSCKDNGENILRLFNAYNLQMLNCMKSTCRTFNSFAIFNCRGNGNFIYRLTKIFLISEKVFSIMLRQNMECFKNIHLLNCYEYIKFSILMHRLNNRV